jgi:hypothetical protein
VAVMDVIPFELIRESLEFLTGSLREKILKEIEKLRGQKLIKSSNEVEVEIYGGPEAFDHYLSISLEERLEIFMVADIFFINNGAILGEETIVVRKTDKPRCQRCWRHQDSVGNYKAFPDTCDRCTRVLVMEYPEYAQGEMDDFLKLTRKYYLLEKEKMNNGK